MVTILISCFNMMKQRILSTQCTYVFRKFPTVNSDYFTSEHQQMETQYEAETELCMKFVLKDNPRVRYLAQKDPQ